MCENCARIVNELRPTQTGLQCSRVFGTLPSVVGRDNRQPQRGGKKGTLAHSGSIPYPLLFKQSNQTPKQQTQ